jgi:hypothetical protein
MEVAQPAEHQPEHPSIRDIGLKFFARLVPSGLRRPLVSKRRNSAEFTHPEQAAFGAQRPFRSVEERVRLEGPRVDHAEAVLDQQCGGALRILHLQLHLDLARRIGLRVVRLWQHFTAR